MSSECIPRNSQERVNQASISGDGVLKDTPLFLPGMQRLSKYLGLVERYISLRPTGILVALLLLAIAAIYVTPSFHVVNNGTSFANLANNPFDRTSNMFGNRILSPLLAYWLGLRGQKFIYFPLLVTIIFLSAIFCHFRRQGHEPVGATLASSVIAFSSPVLFLLHFQGYTDVLTHLLLFWCYVLRKSRIIWMIPLSLSFLNHEATIFSMPWVVFLRTRYTGVAFFSKLGMLYFVSDLALSALAITPLQLLKHFWPLQNVQLSSAFYLGYLQTMWQFIFRFAGFGIFEAFKLFWFLPIFALAAAPRGTKISLLIVLLLMCGAGVGQLAVSHDISRHVGHAFPIVLYSMEILLRRKDWGSRLIECLAILILLNFLVPQYYVGQQNAWPLLPSPVSLILWWWGFNPWNLPFAPWT
jgi:hypothetical protein